MTSSTILLLEALARRPALVGALSLYACFYVAAGRAITRPAPFGPRCAARPRAPSLRPPPPLPDSHLTAIYPTLSAPKGLGEMRGDHGTDRGAAAPKGAAAAEVPRPPPAPCRRARQTPHISPHLPTSPHLSPHLPTSPHISPHLPIFRLARLLLVREHRRTRRDAEVPRRSSPTALLTRTLVTSHTCRGLAARLQLVFEAAPDRRPTPRAEAGGVVRCASAW